MTFLLDTDVLSEPRRPRPDASVLAWMRGVTPSRAFVSVITLGEIRRGIESLRSRPDAIDKVVDLESWQLDLRRGIGPRVVPVDDKIADRWGRLMVELTDAPIAVTDALIAATALANDWTLVTRNVRHFEGTGVRLVNPFGDEP